MAILIANFMLLTAGLYLACGLLFAILFITRGINKVDPGAKGATIGFRFIIFPATVIFWPFLLLKWIRAVKSKDHD